MNIMTQNDIYWEVKKDGNRVAYGPKETLPPKSQRQAMRRDGYRIYVDGKIYKE